MLLLFVSSFMAQAEDLADLKEDVETANKFIATEWRLFNRNLDVFFSNQDYRTKENKSSIAASSSFYKKEGEKFNKQFDLKIKLDLPNVTKKLKIVVEKEQDEISRALSDENLSRQDRSTGASRIGRASSISERDSKYTGGVDYLMTHRKDFRSLVKLGLRIDLPLNPYLKLNLQKEIKNKYMFVDLSQNFLLYRQAGFQEISQVSFNRTWSETYRTDFLNSLVWTDESDIFVLRNNIILYQKLGDEKGLSYSVGANAKFSPTYYYDSYDTSVSYREPLSIAGFYIQLTLGADFPKEKNFKDEKFVQVRFDVYLK